MQLFEDEVVIGRMVILPSRKGYVWLTWVDDGEGMEVPEKALADCLEEFYAENF